MPLSIRGPVDYSRIYSESKPIAPAAANDPGSNDCVRCGDSHAKAMLEGVGRVHHKCMTPAERKARAKAQELAKHPNGRRR